MLPFQAWSPPLKKTESKIIDIKGYDGSKEESENGDDEKSSFQCCSLLKEYNQESTLHGPKYITRRGTHPVERWVSMIDPFFQQGHAKFTSFLPEFVGHLWWFFPFCWAFTWLQMWCWSGKPIPSPWALKIHITPCKMWISLLSLFAQSTKWLLASWCLSFVGLGKCRKQKTR